MTEFKRGDRIAHTTHGEGQIIEVYPSGNVEVCFPYKHQPEHGTLYTILPVEKLEDDVTLLPRPETPLTKMVEKLDNRKPGTRGYIAHRPEIVDILNELSAHVPANVFLDESTYGGEVRVTLKVSFSLERDLL